MANELTSCQAPKILNSTNVFWVQNSWTNFEAQRIESSIDGNNRNSREALSEPSSVATAPGLGRRAVAKPTPWAAFVNELRRTFFDRSRRSP